MDARRLARERNAYLIKTYGITADHYDALLFLQNGACAICKQPPTKRRLAVDHDHVTGRVRGLLCSQCNFGLAHFCDNKRRMLHAFIYLEDFENKLNAELMRSITDAEFPSDDITGF